MSGRDFARGPAADGALSSGEELARIRARQRALRAALNPGALETASAAVCARIAALPVYRDARVVMGYAAVRGEPELGGLLRRALADGKTLLLPRCEGRGVMTARRVADPGALPPGRYGIPEPPPDSEIFPPEEIGLILVPGVAFAPDGARVGQGGGYYDRFLPRCGAYRIGVCHGFALTERLPVRAHDARVHAVATPQGVITCWEESL